MKSGKDYIIFALDVQSTGDAEHFVKTLSGHVAMFKVGLELFIRSGPQIIRIIREQSGAGVFLDLKLHDIPATVGRSMKIIADLGVNLTELDSDALMKNG